MSAPLRNAGSAESKGTGPTPQPLISAAASESAVFTRKRAEGTGSFTRPSGPSKSQ